MRKCDIKHITIALYNIGTSHFLHRYTVEKLKKVPHRIQYEKSIKCLYIKFSMLGNTYIYILCIYAYTENVKQTEKEEKHSTS